MWGRAVLTLLLLAGTACDALRVAEDFQERSVDTGRVTVTVLPGPGGAELPKALAMEIEAEIAGAGDRMRLVVDAGDFKGGNPNGPDGEIILDGRETIYLRPLGPGTGLPRGKKWIEMDADEAARLVPEFEGITRFVDAKGLLSTTSLPEDDATGNETIDGVETRRYEMSAGLDEMQELAGVPPDVLEEMEAAAPGEDFHMEAWVDEEGFMRRFTVPILASYLVPRLDDEPVLLRFDVSDLGEDISIDLPADEEVMTL